MKLDFAKGSYQSLWAYTSYIHAKREEAPKAFRQANKVLPMGGVLGVGFIEGQGEEIRPMAKDMPGDILFTYYQPQEVNRLLEEAGFEVFHFGTYQPHSRVYLNFIARKIKNMVETEADINQLLKEAYRL